MEKDYLTIPVVAENKEHLIKLIDKAIEIGGNSVDLNFIDVSGITDMSKLFYFSQFNGDISQWDVSCVEDMSQMFYGSSFNGDISNWDVSSLENVGAMFWHSEFIRDIPNWDKSNIVLNFDQVLYTQDGIKYVLAINKEVTYAIVRGHTTLLEDRKGYINLIIPEYVNFEGEQYVVIKILDYAFVRCSALISVNLPASLNFIGTYAFANCRQLEKITFRSNVRFQPYKKETVFDNTRLKDIYIFSNEVNNLFDFFEFLDGITPTEHVGSNYLNPENVTIHLLKNVTRKGVISRMIDIKYSVLEDLA